MFKKLTAYQLAECWTTIRTEGHYLSRDVEKLKGDARLIQARVCSDRIAEAIKKLAFHEAALVLEKNKKKKGA